MESCLFCKIIQKEIKAHIEYEDDDFLAFYDIHPQAPIHILIIPKKHIESISGMKESDSPLMGKLIHLAKQIADKNKWAGFRFVFNNGAGAGQSVFHVHGHLLSGRPMKWPPG